MKYFFASLLCFIMCSAQAWTCPQNFNTISPGDSIIQVKRQCGVPTKTKVTQSDVDVPQQWTYYVDVKSGPYRESKNSIQMVVTFVKNKAANISVNGQSMVGTGICGNGIKVGDPQATVKGACGDPAFVYKNEAQVIEKSKEITEFTYDGSPPVTLIFENGFLTERQ